MNERLFKGESFENRYKITGTLTALSPLHIGDGEMASGAGRLPKPEDGKEVPKFSTVITDVDGRAYIPGSTLKGNLRSWLTQIFSSISGGKLARVNDEGREVELRSQAEERRKKNQNLHDLPTMTEYLFGSGINEGKLEFWDAPMCNPPKMPTKSPVVYAGYDETRGAIILKSVAIDPVTGTAAKNKLYNYEVVPKGIKFQVIVAGQNLSGPELGLLFFALEGFNSFIYPVTLGAMGGVGFGRFKFKPETIHYLDKENFQNWMQEAIRTGHAGYTSIPTLSEKESLARIKQFKDMFPNVTSKEV